ncbi:hypothetical protein [Actinophytocola oryzae]|uniref:DUF5666 domain-containing protein n=1 Tax=Actinophytocola oryzae TaxID=502181 RepID=A0A4V3FQF8_9PSEU|nr:hypothetical protein [Actinophytocola oryzae]TDV38676.1 hypothetical protein CLV71_12661 [Actinophytocola oryzae]
MNRKSLWQAGIAVAVVGAVSVGAIGIASASDGPVRPAAQGTTDATPDGHPWHGGPWGGGPRGPFGGGPFGGALDDVLGADVTDFVHAEVVLAKEGGGTQTVLVQKGSVTDVSGTGVTVKSADGVTATYTVNGDTKVHGDSDAIGSVAKDEEVVVVAPKSGDDHTATVVVDLTDLGWK